MGQREILSAIDTRQVVAELARGICMAPATVLMGSQESQSGCGVSQNDAQGAGCPAPDTRQAEAERKLAVLVPDALNVLNMQPGELGLALGDLLRASIHEQCLLPIRQIDLSRDFQLNESGILALTREAAKAKHVSFPATRAFVMTYHLQPTKLTLVARELTLASATITRVSTQEVHWGCQRDATGAKQFAWWSTE